MLKYIAPLVRDPGRSHDAFVDTWKREFTPALEEIAGLVRTHQVLPTEPAHAEFDGLVELYFDGFESFQAAIGTRDLPGEEAIAGALADEQPPAFVGEEVIQKGETAGDTDGLYKHSAFLVRQDGMSHEAFVEHWQSTHTPIAREIEGVVRYTTVLPADPEHASFDGVAELYFAELEHLYDALGSEGSRDYDPDRGKAKEAREDVDNFLAIDRRPRLIGQEWVVTG